MPTNTELRWDQTGERIFETGDKNLALYVMNDDGSYAAGVAWNGLTSISETPSGAEATDLWADDIKYAVMRSSEQYGGTIEAYQSPIQFDQCDGAAGENGVAVRQQKRRAFGLSYLTTVGNDVELNDYSEKLHLIYNATANPSDRSHSTINDSPEAITFSWEYTTTPVDVNGTVTVKKTATGTETSETVEGYKPTACIVVTKIKANSSAGVVGNEATFEYLKDILWGRNGETPRLPSPTEVVGMFQS